MKGFARALGVLALALSACGYHLAGEQRDPLAPFTVTAGAARVASPEAIAAAEDGARVELARSGDLATGADPASALVIEVLAIDETAEGIAAVPGSTGAFPLARGTRVVITGRGTIRRGSRVERDTGEMRASEVLARSPDAAASLVGRSEAIRRAAHLLGERLVRRLLGYPEPSEL